MRLKTYVVVALCLLQVVFAGYAVQEVFRDTKCQENSYYNFFIMDYCNENTITQQVGNNITKYEYNNSLCSNSSSPSIVSSYSIGDCVVYDDYNNNNAYRWSIVNSISIPYSSPSYQIISYAGKQCGDYQTILSLQVYGNNFCNANVLGSSYEYLKCDKETYTTKNYMSIDCTGIIHDDSSTSFQCSDYNTTFLEDSCYIPQSY